MFFDDIFPKKRLSKPKNDDPSRLFSLFCSSTCYPFDGHAKCMKPAKTHKLNCNTFAAPKKVVPTVSTRYNREQLEQLGKYTGKLLVTTDPGIRVWYGMVWWFTRKMAKPVKGHHFQRYKHITRLFPYDFPIISLVVPCCSLLYSIFPYFSPIVPYCFYYLPIISLLVPYFCPIISLYIISLFYPIIVPYASQVSKTINLDT